MEIITQKIIVDAVPSNHAWMEGGTYVWTGRRGRVIALYTAVPTKQCDKDRFSMLAVLQNSFMKLICRAFPLCSG